MKRNLVYLLSLLTLTAVVAGCAKKPATINYQQTLPVGNFTGKFVRLHLTHATGKIDTVNANLLLSLDASGNFVVTGDTSLHAGSMGKYGFGVTDDLIFTDKTLSATGTPTKSHLSGDYQFTYNSGLLEMLKLVSDSLSYQYQFTKN
ncbi:MAG TPA: hypothetical protein VGN20_28920 [Mucilaginibacter sp.]|jgi:hypothetical protein